MPADKEPERKRRSRRDRLSLHPLTLEEAATAIMEVPPPPKDKEKAPPKERRPRRRPSTN